MHACMACVLYAVFMMLVHVCVFVYTYVCVSTYIYTQFEYTHNIICTHKHSHAHTCVTFLGFIILLASNSVSYISWPRRHSIG